MIVAEPKRAKRKRKAPPVEIETFDPVIIHAEPMPDPIEATEDLPRGATGRVSLAELQMKRRGGLVCPKCACVDLRVVYTKSRLGGRVVRQRACRNCGHKMTTVERIIG